MGPLFVTCAPDLTPKEIDKIKGVKVFRRMTKEALEYAVGFWEKEKRLGGAEENSEFISTAN